MNTITRDQLQGMAALHTALAKMDGYKIDKKAARYSAMADYMEHVATCGSANPLSALSEAVLTAVSSDPMNIPVQPFDRSKWRWMEGAA